MKRKLKPILLVCLAAMLALVMAIPITAGAAARAVKVSAVRTTGATEQMVVKGLTKSNKVVWKYTTSKYNATELQFTKCRVNGTRVYIFDGTTMRVVRKSTGAKISVTKNIVKAGHIVGFDGNKNVYVTGYYDTTLYKISPAGKILWQTKYDSTGNYWAKRIVVKSGKVTVICDASDSDPGTSGNFPVVFSADKGVIQ